MKAFYEFLRKNKVLASYKKGTKNIKNKLPFMAINELLNITFCWTRTKEGFNFWNTINKKWQTYLEENPDIKTQYDTESKPIKFKWTLGFELEANPEDTYIDELHNDDIIHNDYSWENDQIKELQIKVIKMKNFNDFIKIYTPIAAAVGDIFSEGESDEYAGSCHTHIGLSKNNMGNYLPMYIIDIFPQMFQRKHGEWRDAIAYRARLNKKIKTNSKESAVTYNNVGGGTIEFRINECPLPLWAYLIPFFQYHTEEYWNEKLKEVSRKKNTTYWIKISDFNYKVFTTTQNEFRKTLLKEVENEMIKFTLNFWKIKSKTFEKAISLYIKSFFDYKKVFKDIFVPYMNRYYKDSLNTKFIREYNIL